MRNSATTLKQLVKRMLLSLTICSISLIAFSQPGKIDSLLTIIQKDNEDTTKANHLKDLCGLYLSIGDYNNAMNYCKITLLLSQKLKYQKGIAGTYNNIGNIHKDQGEYDKALEYYHLALKIGETSGDKKRVSIQYGNIGTVYWSQSNYPMALQYFSNALRLSEELGNKSHMASWLNNIANVYSEQGNDSKALEYYFKALKINEEIAELIGVSDNLGNIGITYLEQGNNQKALEYFHKALKIANKLEDKREIAAWQGSIGTVYSNMANSQRDKHDTSAAIELFMKALVYYKKALVISDEIGEKRLFAINLGNIGLVYCNIGEHEKALNYYFKELEIDEELNNVEGRSSTLNNIGDLFIKKQQFNEAEKYLKEALLLANKSDALKTKMDIEYNLTSLYSKIGKHALALEYYSKYIDLRDSIYSKEAYRKQTMTEMNYEFEKKEAVTKAIHDKEIAIAEAEKKKQIIVTWSVTGSLFMVILFAGFIFRSLRITRSQKKIIEVQKLEVEMQKSQVEQQKHTIEEKNKDITDSINYARRIQKAMLPHRKDIWTAFPQSFVLFKPKDIVSGDFYFFHQKESASFIASADCTGHGVPGAFMSMIGSAKLNDAVSESSDTSEILSLLNKGVKIALKQSEEDEKATRDGMDIALCSVDANASIVKYAGANRPIWIIRNGSTAVEEIKATKKAIGGFTEDSQHFESHEIKLGPGDTFYLHTDGFADTFGGAEQKKVTTKRFKEILLSIQDKTMKEQERHLDSFIEDWKAGTEQIDDILVIGVRL